MMMYSTISSDRLHEESIPSSVLKLSREVDCSCTYIYIYIHVYTTVLPSAFWDRGSLCLVSINPFDVVVGVARML